MAWGQVAQMASGLLLVVLPMGSAHSSWQDCLEGGLAGPSSSQLLKLLACMPVCFWFHYSRLFCL